MKKLLGLLFCASLIALTSCEESNPAPTTLSNYKNGVFVINEGGIGKNNGSLSFFSRDSNIMTNNLFFASNNAPNVEEVDKKVIGDIFQSMTIIGGEAYLVANNSQKVTIIDMKDLSIVTTIENLSYPRFVVAGSNNTAYISNGNGFGGDAIYVLNTNTYSITDTIVVGNGPERMLLNGNKLFVTCMGGWSTDNRVYVVDINSNEVDTTLMVGDRPGDIVRDANGDIWVLAAGATIYDENWIPVSSSNAQLSQIDADAVSIKDSLVFDGPLAGFGSNFMALSQDGLSIYVSNNDIIEIAVDNKEQTTLIANAGWYGIDVDPKTGYIWGLESSFGSNGTAYVYSEEGDRLNSYEVGEGPNAAIFVE